MGVEVPRPIKAFNATAFLGRWFQTHTSLMPMMAMQKNGYCICSDYSVDFANPKDFRFSGYGK